MHLLATLLLALSAVASASPTSTQDRSGRDGSSLPTGWLDPPTAAFQDAGPVTPAGEDASPEYRRLALMELNFRARYLSVPVSLLDIWYYRTSNGYERPKVRALDLGIEYALSEKPTDWIFYAEYIRALMKPGYWDDVEEPPQHDDGDWVEVNGFGIMAAGAGYGHETPVTSTDKPVSLSMVFGAGLGLGITTGTLDQWHPGSNPGNTDTSCLPNSSAYERYKSCPNDGSKRVPKVVPIVDITASAKVNFADRGTLRIEGGIHDVLYYGAAIGGVF